VPLPNIVGFTFGYAFLPTYTSVSDICRTAEARKVLGVAPETRSPLRREASVPRPLLRALFTVVRRPNTMMAVPTPPTPAQSAAVGRNWRGSPDQVLSRFGRVTSPSGLATS